MSLDAPSGGTNLGNAYGRIVFSSNANQAMGQAQQQLQNGLQRVGSTVTNLGFTMTKALAPVTGFVTGGILAFGNFDQKLTEISARTGATATEMETVRSTAMQMGQDTAFSATQAADAMLQLLSSGYDLNQTMQALPDVLNLAAAGALDLGFASDAVTDVLAQFRLEAEDASMVTDALARAAGSSSATVTDLIQGFSNVGPLAANFGLSVEETAAVLATFSENGIKGAEAGTQLKSMLTNMTRDTDDVQGMWNQLGISMFDATGAARPLNDVIADLNKALEGATDENRQKVISTLAGSFGQLGLSALLASDGIAPMQESMANAADASTVADAQMSSWKGTVNQLKSTLETFSITVIGPLVENYLKPLVQQVTQIINKMTAWATENPELAAKIGIILGVLAVLGPALIGIGSALSLLGGAIGVLLSPIGLLIGAGFLIYKLFGDQILDAMNMGAKAFGTFKDVLAEGGSVIAAVSATIAGVIGNILYAFGILDDASFVPIRDAIENNLIKVLDTLFNVVTMPLKALGTFKDVLAEGGSVIAAVSATIAGVIGNLGYALGLINDTSFVPIRDAIEDFINTSLTQFIDLLTNIWNLVGPGLQQLGDWFLNSALPGIINFITGTVIPGIERLIEILKGIWNSAGTEIMTFIGAAGAIAGVLATVMGVVGGFGAAWAALTPVIGAVGVAIAALFSPIGIAIIAGAALVTAYTTNFMGIRDFIDNEVRPRLLSFFNWLGRVWEETIKPGLQKLYDWFVTTGLPEAKDFVVNTVWPALEDFVGFLVSIWETISPTLMKVLDWFVTTGLPAVVNFITGTVIPAIGDLIDILVGIWEAVAPHVSAFVSGLDEKFAWLKDNVLDPIYNAINDIVGIAGDAINTLNDVGNFVGDVGGTIGGGISDAADFIGLKDSGGSISRGEMALIGTGAQPELFVPNQSGTMIPNADQLDLGKQVSIGPNYITANSYEEGRAAARGFEEEIAFLMRQRDVGL